MKFFKTFLTKYVFIFFLAFEGCEADHMPEFTPAVTVDNVSVGYFIISIAISSTEYNPKEMGVCYSVKSDFSNAAKQISSYNNTVYLKDLLAGTKYYYKAYISNGTDYVYSQVGFFSTTSIPTTLASVKSYSPAGSTVTKTTFHVSAELTHSDLVSEWGIVMGLRDYSDPTTGRYDKFSTVIDGKQTMYYSNCTANTKYYYSSYAKLLTGEYIYGDIWSVTTAIY